MENKCGTRLSPCGLGFALGLIWAISLAIMAWVAAFSGWARPIIMLLSSAYIGYHASFWGGIIGAIWGFVDWFIGGVLIAWFYNMCICKKSNK